MPRGNGRKNHGVNRERSIAAQKRHQQQRERSRGARAQWLKTKSQMLRYWAQGDVDYPTKNPVR